MDFLGSKCPVCDKNFHADDDIVVCPECGTPHHRECYESLGRCANEELHAQGFDYSGQGGDKSAKSLICRKCGKENDPDAFFCKYCAAPLSRADERSNAGAPENSGFPGFGDVSGNPFKDAMPVYFDPLAGVPADTDLGDGVTAAEAAKYVKQNTPYFIRVFNSIVSSGRSKFNFSAALFTGGYLLYRKMYKLGAVLTAVQAAMMILSVFIRTSYASFYTELANQYYGAASAADLLAFFSGYSSTELLLVYLPSVISIVHIVMMIVLGISFNRMYLKHCKNEIIKIKSSAKENENPDALLQTKGGVNMPLAISLLITNLIINYLPSILQGII